MGCVSSSHTHDFNTNEAGKMKKVERNDTHSNVRRKMIVVHAKKIGLFMEEKGKQGRGGNRPGST